jgi:hypothetical protein
VLEVPRHEDVMGSGDTLPRIHNLGTRWRRVVRFTLRLLYPQVIALGGKKKGGWARPRAGLDEVAKVKNPIIAPVGNRTPVIQPVA